MSDCWLDSIVLVESSDQAIQGFGAGFPIYWDGRAAYIVTCAHVVRNAGGADRIVVSVRQRGGGGSSSTNFRAVLSASGSPDDIDLAVLRVEGLRTPSIL